MNFNLRDHFKFDTSTRRMILWPLALRRKALERVMPGGSDGHALDSRG